MTSMHKPLVLMLGDSLIDYGEWQRRLPAYRVLSSGIPGGRTEELFRRVSLHLPGDLPEAIVVMSGTNNIVFGDHSFIDMLRRISAVLQDSNPQAAIIITSMLPYEIPGIVDSIHAANQQISLICAESGCHYFDLCSEFERSFEPLFDFDGVHLSNRGYQLWSASLAGYLGKLLAKRGY